MEQWKNNETKNMFNKNWNSSTLHSIFEKTCFQLNYTTDRQYVMAAM